MTDVKSVLKRHGPIPGDLVELFAIDGRAVVGFATHGDLAVNWWRKLRPLAQQTECWPVVLGPDEMLAQWRVLLPDYQHLATADILAASEQIAMPDWFRQRYEGEIDGDAAYEAGLHGDWPNAAPTGKFLVPFDSTGAPHERVWFALIPGSTGWTVPSVLRFGPWNVCPSPAEHVAVLRYWHAHYGAEVVTMSGAVLEATVQRPPRDQSAALQLASEQFAYCPDIVLQSTGLQYAGTLEGLGATLLGGSTWYFWWD